MAISPESTWLTSPKGVLEKVRMLFLALPVYVRDDLNQLSRAEKSIWDIQWLESEYSNGGVDQVFFNSTGDRIIETIEALRTIGARQTPEILLEACRFFPDGRPHRDLEARRVQMDEMRTRTLRPFDQFDGKLFQEDEFSLLLDYWKAQPSSGSADSDALKRKRAVHRRFVDLPMNDKGGYERLQAHERWIWEICFFEPRLEESIRLKRYLGVNEHEYPMDALLNALETIGAANVVKLLRLPSKFFPGGGRVRHYFKGNTSTWSRMLEAVEKEYLNIAILDGVLSGPGWEEDLFELLLRKLKEFDANR